VLSLGPLAFAAPWFLLGLLALPIIWWLLRITPPSPKLVRFPAIRLLFRLKQKEEMPAHTPLWLLALRLTLAAMVILALAQPLYNPKAGPAEGNGPLLLVIDNGWASAQQWPARQQYLGDLLDRATRTRRNVMVLATAPSETGLAPTKLLRAAEARIVVQALKPAPWPSRPGDAAKALADVKLPGVSVVWLSDGLERPGSAALAEALTRIGPVTQIFGNRKNLPFVLRPPKVKGGQLTVTIERASGDREALMRIRALDEKGVVLMTTPARIAAGQRQASAVLEMPSELRNRIVRLDILGQKTAGAVVLVDERWRRRPVGIAAAATIRGGQPLLSELYYLERALAPYAELRRAGVRELLGRPIAVILLPDGGPSSAGDRARLDGWIRRGGLLVRFAGPQLAEGEDDLVPVKLRRGGRSVGGAMTWTKPLGLAPFTQAGPFLGLEVPPEVKVSRQVLAEPAAELGAKTWARLVDGTPLVTAERRGKGWLVLIHTTASPDWSNLPLSGLFVEMLRRLVALSQGIAGSDANIALPPREALDGFGRPVRPPASALAIPAKTFAKTRVGPRHPPGLYGSEAVRRSLNLSPSIGRLVAAGPPPPGIVRALLADARQTDFKPWLLAGAILLLLIDIVIGLLMRGLLPRPGRAGALGAILAAGMVFQGLLAAPPAGAQSSSSREDFAIKATSKTRLAYIRTGNAETDRISLAAMRGLSIILRRRTSVEPGTPMAVDPETDELAFFPMLYWPIAVGQTPPSARSAERLNRFMRAGGILLIDLRDPGGRDTFDVLALRRSLGAVRIPRLTPVPRNHVLTKSFYLLQRFPGRWAGGAVWVEQPDRKVNDGVSSVIVGTNDWAGAWAVDSAYRPMFPVVPGGEAQRERAYRTGINIVMYALTGNYKADQVHLPTIMRRLGQ
jgi:Domain of unknown function (DUF4159)/Aerotolerance regulator N-terminal